MNLKNIKTCTLVKELQEREGVEMKRAEPHQDTDISVNGPAIILIITD